MAKILVAWEQGGGWGHLGVLRPLIREFISRRHEVTLAARDLVGCVPTFAGMQVRLVQAPFLPVRAKPPFEQVECYAHLLANIGFDQPGNIIGQVAGWRGLCGLIRPDAVIAEYAPTALLALRGTKVPRAAMGTGFSLPPDVSPLPLMIGPGKSAPALERVERDEAMVLASVNKAISTWGGRPLQQLSHLFHDEVALSILRTYEELDHFGPRPNVRYWGAWPSEGGDIPEWPNGAGKKVFVYLRPCAARDAVLNELRRLGLPTLVSPEGFNAAEIERINGPTLHVARRPLDISHVSTACDLAVLNGGHNTVAAMLLAGKPCVLFPLQMEQYLLAKRIEAMGATKVSSPHDAAAATAALNECVTGETCLAMINNWAKYHAGVPDDLLQKVVAEVERTLVRRTSPFK